MPVSIILTMSRRASVILSRSSAMARFSARTSSARFSISAGARDQRRQIEAEGAFDLAALPSSGEAFAVRRVAPDDQPGLDERREMPAQRRRRHAMGADRELPVRREHDDAGRRRIVLALGFGIASPAASAPFPDGS